MMHQTTQNFGARICVCAALGLAISACVNLDNFLYAPRQAADDADLLERATNIPPTLRKEVRGAIVAADGTIVDAYVLGHTLGDGTPAQRHNTAIMYCHGNARDIDLFSLRAQALWQAGYTLVIFDYRGYGKTKGAPSEMGLYADARAVRAYLGSDEGLGFAPERIALYGYSLGTAICTQMAVEFPAPALILEAPFASIAQLAQDDTSLEVPRAWFTQAAYNTVGKINAHKGALLVLHGERDSYLRPQYGRWVSQAATNAQPNAFVLVAGADHETVPCAITEQRSKEPGGCLGGFSPNYIERVAGVIDAAIAPQTPE
jgi:hypothetical protein